MCMYIYIYLYLNKCELCIKISILIKRLWLRLWTTTSQCWTQHQHRNGKSRGGFVAWFPVAKGDHDIIEIFPERIIRMLFIINPQQPNNYLIAIQASNKSNTISPREMIYGARKCDVSPPTLHLQAPPKKKLQKRPRMSACWIQARGWDFASNFVFQLELVDGHHHNEQRTADHLRDKLL